MKASPDIFMGDTLKYCLELKNTSSEKRVINGTLSLASSYYTGVTYKKIRDFVIDGTELQPGEGTSIPVNKKYSPQYFTAFHISNILPYYISQVYFSFFQIHLKFFFQKCSYFQ